MRLGIKLGLSLTGVVALALAFACVLYYVQYETLFSSLQRSRLAVLATSIRDAVKGGTDLGLALKDMHGVQGVIERTRALDPDISGITVFDRQGRVLFDTDPARIGTTRPDTVAWAAASEAGAAWYLAEGARGVAGQPLLNSFDAVLGGIALDHSRAALFDSLERTALTLARAAAGLLAAIGGAVVLLTVLAVRPLVRAARTMERRLRRWPPGPGRNRRWSAVP